MPGKIKNFLGKSFEKSFPQQIPKMCEKSAPGLNPTTSIYNATIYNKVVSFYNAMGSLVRLGSYFFILN
jgi:hypothetical protein